MIADRFMKKLPLTESKMTVLSNIVAKVTKVADGGQDLDILQLQEEVKRIARAFARGEGLPIVCIRVVFFRS